MSSNDFPAAHSMDTAWFAVDEDGNVARFETGEDGAVPAAADVEQAGDRFPLDVARFLAFTEALDSIPPREVPAPGTVKFRLGAPCRFVVVQRASHAEGASYRATGKRFEDVPKFVPLREHGELRVLVAVEALRLPEIIYRRDVCMFMSEHELAQIFAQADEPLFVYANEDYGNPGAYVRAEVPAAPLVLPTPLVEGAQGWLRLPVRFAEAASLHLADFLRDDEVYTWGDTTLRGEPRSSPRPAQETRAPKKGRELRALAVAALVTFALLAWFATRR